MKRLFARIRWRRVSVSRFWRRPHHAAAAPGCNSAVRQRLRRASPVPDETIAIANGRVLHRCRVRRSSAARC